MKKTSQYFIVGLVLLFSIVTPANAQKATPSEDVKWGVGEIKLDGSTSGLSSGDQAITEVMLQLKGVLSPQDQQQFTAWQIYLKHPKGKRATRKYEQKLNKYLEQTTTASKYFIVVATTMDKNELVKKLKVRLNLPDDTPAYEFMSKKRVEEMAEMMIVKHLREAGLMSN